MTKSEPWFPATTPPIAGHPVELAWSGHVAPGWFEPPTASKARRWCTVSGEGRRRTLKPARGEVVSLWRPLAGQPYPAPLPEPEPFAAIAEARQAAARNTQTPDPATEAATAHATNTTRDRLRAFEDRIQRALKTLLAQPDRERGWLTKQTNWPFETLATRADLNDRQGNAAYLADLELARMNRFRPTRADVADMHDALAYFNALSLPERVRAQRLRAGRLPFSSAQRLIWWRMRGMNFTEMSKKMGVSYELARQRYWAAIDACERAEVGGRRPGQGGAAPFNGAENQDGGRQSRRAAAAPV